MREEGEVNGAVSYTVIDPHRKALVADGLLTLNTATFGLLSAVS